MVRVRLGRTGGDSSGPVRNPKVDGEIGLVAAAIRGRSLKLVRNTSAPTQSPKRKGPEIRAFSEVAGAGFEPATFGLRDRLDPLRYVQYARVCWALAGLNLARSAHIGTTIGTAALLSGATPAVPRTGPVWLLASEPRECGPVPYGRSRRARRLPAPTLSGVRSEVRARIWQDRHSRSRAESRCKLGAGADDCVSFDSGVSLAALGAPPFRAIRVSRRCGQI